MTEELKQKAENFIDSINKESGGNWLDKYYLTDLLVMFATEVTKELKIPCESCHLSLPQDLIDENKKLQEENQILTTLVAKYMQGEEE